MDKTIAINKKRPSSVMRFMRRNPLAAFGILIFAAFVIISVGAPAFARYEPKKQQVAKRLQPPNETFAFGSDQLGRDIQSRVIYAGRTSLPAGVLVVVFAAFIGSAIGVVAAFTGGWADEFTMRITEVFLAFPSIILAMTIAAALGPNLLNAVFAMIIVWWPNYTRLIRAAVLQVKSREFVEAARALGASESRILRRNIIPHTLSPMVVLATTDLGAAILVFAGLSFLGLGPDPSVPEWGRMIADGIQFFDQWWMAFYPGLAIFLIVMAVNFIGDGIRDALDPRIRGQ